MPEDTTNVDVAELLAIIGEQQVMARKREQRINELQNKVKELEEMIKSNGKLG
jgi:hypothetical protein